MNQVQAIQNNTQYLEMDRVLRRFFINRDVLHLCEEATEEQVEFLHRALLRADELREISKRTRLVTLARFPMIKSLEGYDYTALRFPPSISKDELQQCSFIQAKTNIVCYGPVGTGNYASYRVM